MKKSAKDGRGRIHTVAKTSLQLNLRQRERVRERGREG